MSFETERYPKLDLDRFFFDIPAECPYQLPCMAHYRQACLGPLPDDLMEYFLATGFRRNGNIIYTMVCRQCKACIPIRLLTSSFKANRNQQRVWRKNFDLAVNIGNLHVTDEKVAICNRFFEARYPGRGNSPHEYYSGFFMNTVTNTFEFRYSVNDRLIGVSIVDICGNSMNAVYFYFDPDENHRSPGTYNILFLTDFCRNHNIKYLYLGYWVEAVKAMQYKANFKPHYLLLDGTWQRVAKNKGKN